MQGYYRCYHAMMEKCFHAVVLLLIFSFSETEADSCTSGEVKIDTTCPTNCSQEQPRIAGERVFFKCSIGSQKAVDRYRKTHIKDFLPESAVFDAPKVRGVELYWKSYDYGTHFELALKFDFSLPKGALVKSLPKAILLKFESIPGPYGDCYYVENPREKIYEFEFLPKHAYDMVHPRQLQEDCLVGLDQIKTVLVYNITLQTAEGKLASYITTVHVRDTSPGIWKPVIMAFLNETNASLFVVVEKPPSNHNVQSYSVSLVDRQNKILRSVEMKVHDVNTTTFVNLSNFSGQCRVMVTPLCKGNCNRKIDVPTFSYRFMLPGDPGNKRDFPDILDDSLKPMKVVAIVTGCTVGVILVLTIIYFIRQRPKRNGSSPGIRPSCLLLHPFERDCEAVINLKEYISQTCDCAVTDCMDLSQKSGGEIEKMTANKVRSHLRDATVFLILYASDFYKRNATSFHTDFLSCFIKSAINQRQKHNDIRIILLQFPSVTTSELPPLLTKNHLQLLELTNNPDKFYSKLHGLDAVPLNRDDLSTRHNYSQWKEVIAALANTVRHGQNNASAAQGEAEPLLTETNEQKYDEIDQEDLLKEIARFNLDSDSVIGGSNCEISGLPANRNKISTAETSTKAKSENTDQSDRLANCLNRFNFHVCEAEVHNYCEKFSESMPLEAARPAAYHKKEPLSLPPDCKHIHAHNSKDSEIRHHLFRENGNESVEQNDYTPTLNSCNHDQLIHRNLHHLPVCMNSHASGHRELEHLKSNHSESSFYRFQPRVGKYAGNRHLTTYIPHISHEIIDQQSSNHGCHGGHPHQPETIFPNHSQYGRLMYTDDLPYSAKHLNEACGHNMNDFKKDQRSCGREISFNAHDPQVTKHIGPSACLDVNTKHELTKQNTEDLLNVSSSVHSLPTELDVVAFHDAEIYNSFDPPDDLHRDSPHLPHESDPGWESSLMDELAKINKNNK